MKQIAVLTVIILMAAGLNGCAGRESKKEVIATIGDYSLYKEDFASELSLYPPEYRKKLDKKDVLDDMIQKKILLLEAERRGLDRDPQFMKMVERFWEQSLLRSLLDAKSEEILSAIPVTEKDRKQKASEAMKAWIEQLKETTPVIINEEALKNIGIK